MNLTLKIWRQRNAQDKGRLETHEVRDVSPNSSFLEMLDLMNEQLIEKGGEPIAFDHDCREGICGMCSLMINGIPHGPDEATTVCQLHMRHFHDGQTIVVEPWRSRAFPLLRDLMVDRSAFERIIQAGGFVSVNTGGAPDANALPISKEKADLAFDAAACIGCGACVAACRNASAMLFVGAKVSQFLNLPQGQPERKRRALAMVQQMDKEGFGNCSNHYECEAVCPKEIKRQAIGDLNREFMRAGMTGSD
jgi:succinate dehydrogenase / fumarate reductase iron-sulfur subunit